MKHALTFIFLLLSQSAHAQLYKCVNEDGETVYRDQPCPKNTKSNTVSPPRANVDYEAAMRADAARSQRVAEYQRMDRLRYLEAAISDQEARKQNAIARMQQEQAAIRGQKRYARNNLAGAVWEQSLSDEMQAVADRYGAEISSIDATIRNLRDERSMLLNTK